MKKLFLYLFAASTVMFMSCSNEDNPGGGKPYNDPPIHEQMIYILDSMEMVKAYKYVQLDTNDVIQSFIVDVKQPIDHNDMSKGHFLQRMIIHLRDFNAPTVLYTNGYQDRMSDQTYLELADMIGGNVVTLEHRQFGTSRYDDPLHQYLTVEQSADDLHAIYTVLKTIFPNKWISTGTSKDGMTSIFYKKQHPKDMDVATSFCSPFLTSLFDMRVGTYMVNECGTKENNEEMKKVLRAMTTEDMYTKYVNYRIQTGQQPFDVRDYLNLGFDAYFRINSYLDDRFYWTRPSVPLDSAYMCKWLDWKGDTSNKEAMNAVALEWLRLHPQNSHRVAPKTDDLIPLIPAYNSSYSYYLQCAKQLGTYAYDIDIIKDLLPEGFSILYFENPSFLADQDIWLYETYDNTFVTSVLDYLSTTSDPIMMVYSKNDPWTGGRPEKTGPGIKTIINPLGVHNHDFYNTKHYDDASFEAIRDFVGQYFKIVNPTRTPQVKMRPFTAEELAL